MKRFIMVAVLAALMAGCTDASMAKLTSLGSSASVKCYSGTLLIYEGRSTGKILSEPNSDGYFFKDESTGKNVEISGNCVIRYE